MHNIESERWLVYLVIISITSICIGYLVRVFDALIGSILIIFSGVSALIVALVILTYVEPI